MRGVPDGGSSVSLRHRAGEFKGCLVGGGNGGGLESRSQGQDRREGVFQRMSQVGGGKGRGPGNRGRGGTSRHQEGVKRERSVGETLGSKGHLSLQLNPGVKEVNWTKREGCQECPQG